jgi:mRNA-degrading endonuclease toxin of MazEF toxin-antitoxin module
MPAAASDRSEIGLRRGAVAWGAFPFAAQFPMRWLDDGERPQTLASIDEYATQRRGKPTHAICEVKLRPVLLLHEGADERSGDVAVLRINSVRPRHRESPSWRAIAAREHPFFFHLPKTCPRYRLPEESIVSLTSISTVHKNALLRVRGALNAHEMQKIDERLVRVLALDLGPYIAIRAREMLRRAGIAV